MRDYEWKDVGAGKQREPVVAELEPEAVIQGVVKDEVSGEPVADAKVWVRPWFDPNQGTWVRAPPLPTLIVRLFSCCPCPL